MPALVSKGIERLRPYVPGKPVEEVARELGISDAVKLASNENPLGPSRHAIEAGVAAFGQLHRYPDAGCFVLRQALAAQLGVDPAELVFGNGSNELLELVVRTFCPPGSHIVFADPSFVVYEMASLAADLPYTAVPLNGYRHDLEAMLAACRGDTRVVFIANPNNPTGTYVTQSEVAAFLAAVPKHIFVVLDEAYFEYADASDYPDGLTMRTGHERLIVLRTFSKAYGLAGLRLGYGVLGPVYADYVNRVRAPFNANSLAQASAVAALRDTEHLRRVLELNHRERARVTAALLAMGLNVVPSQANFVFVPRTDDALDLYQRMMRKGVIVRPMGPNGLRISIGLPEENERLLSAMKEVL